MSLRYGIIIVVFLCVLIAGGLFLRARYSTPQDRVQDPSEFQQYSNATYGLSFLYPDRYVFSEMDIPGGAMREHHVITLMRKEDLPLPTDGEGPPTITINIYQNNLDNQTTEGWIRNTNESNFKLSEGKFSSTTISTLDALSYRWSGLYEGTTIVHAQSNWVYTFTVTYLEMGAPIVQDFVAIRDSVRIVE